MALDVHIMRDELLKEQEVLFKQYGQVQQLLKELEMKLLKIEGKLELLTAIEEQE